MNNFENPWKPSPQGEKNAHVHLHTQFLVQFQFSGPLKLVYGPSGDPWTRQAKNLWIWIFALTMEGPPSTVLHIVDNWKMRK